MNFNLHSAQDGHTVKWQTRIELVETTAGNLIVFLKMDLMLSLDVACKVGQMERRR